MKRNAAWRVAAKVAVVGSAVRARAAIVSDSTLAFFLCSCFFFVSLFSRQHSRNSARSALKGLRAAFHVIRLPNILEMGTSLVSSYEAVLQPAYEWKMHLPPPHSLVLSRYNGGLFRRF